MAEYNITLDTGTDTREWLEAATLMPNGNIAHAWLQFKSDGSNVPTIRVLQPDGTVVTGEYEPPIPDAGTDYRDVEIHAVSDTQFIVTYTAFNLTTFGLDLYASVLTLSGTTFSSQTPVQITGSDISGYSGSVGTHLMADGTLAVATSLVTESPSNAEMYVKTLQIDGSGQLAAISQGVAGFGGTSGFVQVGQQNELQPGSVQLDSNGTSLYIGWSQNSDSNTSTKAYGTVVTVNANGTVSGVPATETLLREGTNGGSFPSVSMDDFVVLENGDLLLLSNGKVATGGSVSDSDNLYGQVWNSTLTAKIGAEFQINATTDANSTSGEHAVAFKGGGFVVFFSQDKHPTDDFTRDVYYQIFDNTYAKVGGLVNVTNTTDTPLPLDDAESLGLRVADDGDVVLVVEQTSYDYSDFDPFGDNEQLRAITLSNLDPNPVVSNTAPVLGATAPDVTALEDVATAIDLSAYDVSDADGDTVTLTLAVNSGTIASIDGNTTIAGVTVANSGTGSMTLTGTAASLNAYLDNTTKITFTTAANQTSAVTLTVTPNDDTVNGSADTVTINVTPVNDEPTLSVTGNTPTFIEGGSAVSAFGSATTSTVEPGQLIDLFQFKVGVLPDGTDEYFVINGTNRYSGETVSLGAAGGITTSSVDFYIEGITYVNNSDNPTPGARTVDVVLMRDNGSGVAPNDNVATNLATATVTVVPVNDAPVVGNVFGEAASISAVSGAQNVSLFDNATIAEPDSPDYSGGFLNITQSSGVANGSWGLDGTTATSGGDGTLSAGEIVSVGGNQIGTISATASGQGGSQLQFQFDAGATPARIETLMQALTYDAPSGTGSRAFTLTLNDGDGTANTGDEDTSGSFTINVNSAPPVIGNLDGDSARTTTGTPVLIDVGGDATVTDADTSDFGGGVLTITPTSGFLGNLGLRGGTTFPTIVAENDTLPIQGDGIADTGDFIIEAFGANNGTIIGAVVAGNDGKSGNALSISIDAGDGAAEVAKILQNVTYDSTQVGLHTFDVALSDGSSSFAGTAETVSFSVDITEPPVNTVPSGTLDALVDTAPFAFTGTNAISVADADSATVTVRLDVTDGPGFTSATGALSTTASGLAAVTQIDADSLSIAGTLLDVNATLTNLVFTPAENSGNGKLLTVTATDPNGNVDVDTILLDVQDRPNITIGLTAFDYPENSGPVSLLDAGSSSFLENDADGLVFTEYTLVAALSGGATATETLGLDTSGRVSLSAGLTVGSVVSIDGNAVGMIVTPDAPGELAIDITSDAYDSGVIVGSLTYLNTLLDVSAERTLTVRLDQDGLPQSDEASILINVMAVNDPPSLTLTPLVMAQDENTVIATRLKVADLTITDDTLGDNILNITGPDASAFEIDGLELFLRAGAVLDFESDPTLDLVVELDDPDLGITFEDSVSFSLTVNDVNEAPSVEVRRTLSEIAENESTAVRIRVGDVQVFDDAAGSNVVSITGPDAAFFEIDGTDLYIRAGSVLDFETNPLLEATISAVDADVAGVPVSSDTISIAVTDANDPPTLVVTPLVDGLAEGTYGPGRKAVATLTVIDDPLGNNALSFDGEDASFFQIDGNTLYLRSGVSLDHGITPALDITLRVNDLALGAGFDDSTALSLAVFDSNQSGASTDDLLIGTPAADSLFGFGGNDTLIGLGEDDLLDGGAGDGDVAVFAGPAADYTITVTPTGTIITDQRTGGSGSDRLVDIEIIRFNDSPTEDPDSGTEVDLANIAGAAGVTEAQLEAITLLYIGLYDRAPDALGLLFWATQLANGTTMETIAAAFIDSPEAIAIYGSAPSSREIVAEAYQNFFDRDVDLAGRLFWDGLLELGVITPAEFFTVLTEGVRPESQDALTLQDQIDVGLYFSAINGLSDVTEAVSALGVYDTGNRESSLLAAKDLIDDFAADTDEIHVQLTGIVESAFDSLG